VTSKERAVEQTIRLNVFADTGRRINTENEFERLVFHEVQDDDKEFGPISEPPLRTLGLFYRVHTRGHRYVADLADEPNIGRQSDLINDLIDPTFLDAEFFLFLYAKQLAVEPALASWKGLPLFTIRTGGIAVIRKKELDYHRRHTQHRPYKAGNISSLLAHIALESVKEVKSR
jgi:hypothetical protein